MDFISLFIALAVTAGVVELLAAVIYGTAFLHYTRDILHALRLWARHFLVLLWNAWRRRQLRRLKRSEDAKCPSCGHNRGHMQARRDLRLLVHTCLVCNAQWGEPFLLAPELWVHDPPPGG